MNLLHHIVVKTGLALLYIATCLLLVLLFPPLIRPWLLLLFLVFLAWTLWNYEEQAEWEMDLRLLTPWGRKSCWPLPATNWRHRRGRAWLRMVSWLAGSMPPAMAVLCPPDMPLTLPDPLAEADAAGLFYPGMEVRLGTVAVGAKLYAGLQATFPGKRLVLAFTEPHAADADGGALKQQRRLPFSV